MISISLFILFTSCIKYLGLAQSSCIDQLLLSWCKQVCSPFLALRYLLQQNSSAHLTVVLYCRANKWQVWSLCASLDREEEEEWSTLNPVNVCTGVVRKGPGYLILWAGSPKINLDCASNVTICVFVAVVCAYDAQYFKRKSILTCLP